MKKKTIYMFEESDIIPGLQLKQDSKSYVLASVRQGNEYCWTLVCFETGQLSYISASKDYTYGFLNNSHYQPYRVSDQ